MRTTPRPEPPSLHASHQSKEERRADNYTEPTLSGWIGDEAEVEDVASPSDRGLASDPPLTPEGPSLEASRNEGRPGRRLRGTAPIEFKPGSKVRHGTHTGYSYGCRCDECREFRRIEAEQRRREAGVPEFVPAPHGTANKYRNGCRCDECRAAHTIAIREYYREHLAHPKPIPEHGTESRYTGRGCRCEQCRKASADARRRRRRQAVAA